MPARTVDSFYEGLVTETVAGGLTPEQEDAIGWWGEHPYNFLASTWPLQGTKTRPAEPLIWTVDSWTREIRPFPNQDADMGYIRDAILEPIFMWEPQSLGDRLRVVGDKPRQVMFTTVMVLGMGWEVLFREAVTWLFAKNKREEAEALLDEKLRFAYRRLPEFVKAWRPVRDIPKGRFHSPDTSGTVKAVARNFGRSEAHGGTNDVFVDEAVLLDKFRAAWEAAAPSARRMVAVATPPEPEDQPDPDSVACFLELVRGLPPRSLAPVSVVSAADHEADEDEDALAEVDA